MLSSTVPLPQSFISKKRKILEQLSVPVSEYDDLSPKGSVDEGIRDLIDEINQIEGCVTTSSCAGRTSIFVEGKKNPNNHDHEVAEDDGEEEPETQAGVGGKGGGGRWLFVSHVPLDWRKRESKLNELFGMHRTDMDLDRDLHSEKPGWERWVHFKFEPMILHIFTASLQQAQVVLSAALQAGFRESGAINLVSSSNEPATPMVAVRSMGLAVESIVGCYSEGIARPICIVPEETLECLVDIANERFRENGIRIERFRALLKRLSTEASGEVKKKGQDGDEWEDPQVRRERKKAEGVMRSRQMKDSKEPQESEGAETLDLHLLAHNI